MQAKSKIRFGRRLNLQEMRTTMHIYAEDIGEPGKDTRHGFGVFSFGRFEKEEYIRPEIKIELGSPIYYVDGIRKEMDTSPVLDKNNRTLYFVCYLTQERGQSVDFILPKQF